jgi:hypothetical protein
MDDAHRPDKRWLIDFISSFKPDDEIFQKSYRPPAKAFKLSEMKTISMPKDFMEGLAVSKRRSRRKGLRVAKDGLAQQKKERFKHMQKKYGDLLLDEEVKNDERKMSKSKSKVKSVRSTTNENSFRQPTTTTPTKRIGGSNASSAVSSKGSVMNSQMQMSPGLVNKMDGITLSMSSGSNK